jgi:hypothetical protein
MRLDRAGDVAFGMALAVARRIRVGLAGVRAFRIALLSAHLLAELNVHGAGADLLAVLAAT